MRKEFIYPVRICMAEGTENSETLLSKSDYLQIGLAETEYAILHCGASIVLDFGKEYCGGVRILTYQVEGKCRVRIRFGESIGEACAELGEKGASNDHSLRDFEADLERYSDMQFGQTAYRFIRLDMLSGTSLKIKKILGTFEYFDAPVQGSFHCNDERLNKIFDTAAYTLKLCVQNGMVWDGVKRDRLVWIGDMHPETIGLLCLYGSQDCIKNSLRFIREQTPLPAFMNGMPSYSLWWIAILCDYYRYTGDEAFLRENSTYLSALVEQLNVCVDEKGDVRFPESPDQFFLDWATYQKPESRSGVYALLCFALQKLLPITDMVGIPQEKITELCRRVRSDLPHANAKQVIALQTLAGHIGIDDGTQRLLTADGAKGISAFMSYYILHALCVSGGKIEATRLLKEYFGSMLDLGATTFWEEFKTDWAEHACSVDVIPEEGEWDIHGDFGERCYRGYRRSLCHGWSAGAVPFLLHDVLGVQILESGFKKVKISPYLGDLCWIEGSVPTPFGVIKVRVSKQEGKEQIEVSAPSEIEILTDKDGDVKIEKK